MMTIYSAPKCLLLILLLTSTGIVLGQQTDPAPESVVGLAPTIAPESGKRLDELDIAIANQ